MPHITHRHIYSILYLTAYSCYLIFQFRKTDKTVFSETIDVANYVSLFMFISIIVNHIINNDSIYQITLGIMYVLYTINDIVNTTAIDEYRQSREIGRAHV